MLRRNTEKYLTFSIPIEKEVKRISKNGEKNIKTISHTLQLSDDARFIASSSSNLVNNLTEGIHKIKRKYGHDNQNCKTCGKKFRRLGVLPWIHKR